MSWVELSKLEIMGSGFQEKNAIKIPRGSTVDWQMKAVNFQPVLDVRGKRVEEVLPILEQFLDHAVLLSQAEVKIIHGKGEGVLRKVVREVLKQTKNVASCHDEQIERGGDGATVVILK